MKKKKRSNKKRLSIKRVIIGIVTFIGTILTIYVLLPQVFEPIIRPLLPHRQKSLIDKELVAHILPFTSTPPTFHSISPDGTYKLIQWSIDLKIVNSGKSNVTITSMGVVWNSVTFPNYLIRTQKFTQGPPAIALNEPLYPQLVAEDIKTPLKPLVFPFQVKAGEEKYIKLACLLKAYDPKDRIISFLAEKPRKHSLLSVFQEIFNPKEIGECLLLPILMQNFTIDILLANGKHINLDSTLEGVAIIYAGEYLIDSPEQESEIRKYIEGFILKVVSQLDQKIQAKTKAIQFLHYRPGRIYKVELRKGNLDINFLLTELDMSIEIKTEKVKHEHYYYTLFERFLEKSNDLSRSNYIISQKSLEQTKQIIIEAINKMENGEKHWLRSPKGALTPEIARLLLEIYTEVEN